MNDTLINELKLLIIETCRLEGVKPDDIDASAPIFGSGLGLDSIDSLELSLAVKSRYAIPAEAAADNTKMREHFSSIENLANFVAKTRKDNNAAETV